MQKELAQLDSIHQRLLDLIRSIDEERFRQRPAPDRWSIAEIVHHLCMVEQRVLEQLEASLAQPAVHVGLLQRLIPVSLLVGSRVVRVKAPKAVEPLDAPSKAEAIANFEEVRRTLREFTATHGRERLQQLGLKHPFLGTFDGVGAVLYVGHHERRHFKQLKETIRKLGG
jgi:hypothetical protein